MGINEPFANKSELYQDTPKMGFVLKKARTVTQSFGFSFIFHLFIAVVFFVSLSDSLMSIPPSSSIAEVQNNKEIVNAVAISEDDLSQEIRAQQAADAAAKAKAASEAKQLAAAKAQALAQIQQAKQEQAALAVKQQADAKKAADQLAQLQIQQKQAALQLAQTQAQAAAAAKKAADAQAAQKAADAQAAQKAADAKRAAQKQQALTAQKTAAAASANTQMQNEINRYVGLITQAIQAQWTQLPGVDQQKLATTMLIRLAADGTVLQVQNVGSSGNPALDRLALTAVYKASPLPVPTDPALFANFRELKVQFSDS